MLHTFECVEFLQAVLPKVKKYLNKEEVTARLLDYYNPKSSLIFCNTKRGVDELAEVLKGRGYFAEGFHDRPISVL